MKISRRYFFFGSLAVVAAAYRRSATVSAHGERYPVSIVKAASYSAELAGPIKQILLDHRVAVLGKRVLLKPNLVEFDPAKPINTHPAFVAASKGSVPVVGGPISTHRRRARTPARDTGHG